MSRAMLAAAGMTRKAFRKRFARFKPLDMSWDAFEDFAASWVLNPPTSGECCRCGAEVAIEDMETHRCEAQ